MAYQNNVTLLGHIGQNPEIKVLTSGIEVAIFSLAVSMPQKKGDEYEYVAEWHNCKAFGKTATRIAKLNKGDKIGVVGEYRIETWEKDGEKKSRAVVLIQQVQVIVKKEIETLPANDDWQITDDPPF